MLTTRARESIRQAHGTARSLIFIFLPRNYFIRHRAGSYHKLRPSAGCYLPDGFSLQITARGPPFGSPVIGSNRTHHVPCVCVCVRFPERISDIGMVPPSGVPVPVLCRSRIASGTDRVAPITDRFYSTFYTRKTLARSANSAAINLRPRDQQIKHHILQRLASAVPAKQHLPATPVRRQRNHPGVMDTDGQFRDVMGL